MPTYEFTAPDGKTYEVGAPEGATQEQAFQILQGQIAGGTAPAAAPASAAFSAGRAVNDVGRQLGLTARYALEGPAQALQVVTEPIRYFTDKLLPDRGGVSNLVTGQPAPPKSTPLGVQASKLADTLGLPTPQNANERVIGDATRLVAGAGSMAGAANAGARALATPVSNFVAGLADAPVVQGVQNAAGAAVPAGQNLLRGLAANPMSQLTAAAGAGLAGGASREAGGGPWQQGGAALIGAVLGGVAPSAAQPLIDAGRRALTPKMTPQQLDVQLSTVLQRAGTDYSQLPANVQQSLRAELADALRAGRELDPAAVARLAEFRSVGATPTRGMISQNPVQITREQNLAKMAANSADGELHGLPLMQNQNNQTLIGRLNDLGGRSEVDPVTAGRVLTGRVQDTQAALRGAERTAWTEARNAPGYTQPIYPDGLNAINRALGDEGMMGFMNPTISRYMEAFQTGQQPFTPQAYRNLQSMLAGELAKGGNEAAAAGIARRALEASPMRPLTNPGGIDFGAAPVTAGLAGAMRSADAQPAAAIDAVNRARAATRAAYQYEDSSPLVRSVLSDGASADPARIAQRFVIGGTPDEAATVAREVGDAGRATIRDALATYIKRQSLSGAADEVGKVSQSRLNATLNKIGDEKLRLFFSPEEVAQLRSVGRVASLIQVQPVGSAVNNSNSGALLLGRGMDMLNGVAGRIPFGQAAIVDPLRNLNISISQRAAQNVGPGLLREAPAVAAPGATFLLPGAAVAGGLLSAQ
jgi:hypothetical protein